MAYYIKANPKVAKFLGKDGHRMRVKDGNYLLWQADMLAFGPMYMLHANAAAIGGLVLQPHEARQEQDGTACRELPVATDERFVMDEPSAEQMEEMAESTDVQPEETESLLPDGGESEEPAEEGEEGA